MSNDTTTVRLGPQDADVGQSLKIARRLSTVDDTHADATYVVYELRGVVEVDIQTPYDMGSSSPEAQIGVTFPSGRTEYIMGVIEDFGDSSPEIHAGTSVGQRDRIKAVKQVTERLDSEHEEGAHIDAVIDECVSELDMDPERVAGEIEKLRTKGEVYEPKADHLRTT